MAEHQHSLPSFYNDQDPSLLINSIISQLQMITEGVTPDNTHGSVDYGLKIILADFNNPERYEMLIQSGILEALVKLYSPQKFSYSGGDDTYVRLLLDWMTAPSLTTCLHERASVVLELCLSFIRLGMCAETLLYVLTVRSLRDLAEKGKYELHFKCNMDTLTHIPLIVTDLRDRLVRNLNWCLISPSSMENTENFLSDFRDFKVFSRILCGEIRKSYPEDNYICEGKMDSLYHDFCALLTKIDELLGKLDLTEEGKINERKLRHEWSLYLPILEELNFISKLYKGKEEQYWDVLKGKKASVRALITRFAERTEAYDYEWLLEHNDVTDSDSRMHLALVMIPQVKLQPSWELIQKLADWSQNLGIHLLGVVQNKKLTDPQVLEEWLCRSSEAIFNSRRNPLFLECSYDPTRFRMNHDLKPVPFHDDWPAPFHYDCAEFAGKVIALALIYKVRIGVQLDHGFLSQLKEERDDDDSSLVSFFVKGFSDVFGVSIKDLQSFKGLDDEDMNEVLHRSHNSNGIGKKEADLDLLSQYQKVRILGRNIKTWQRSSELGRGSFGQVYKCLADHGFFFAAKKVPLVEAEKAKTVKHEIGLLCQFNHENIVEYFGTRKEDSELYIFLEFVNGGSLENVYKQFPLTDLQVSRYTKQILKGLKYLHERGVKHGDLKCANILLNKKGCVKIADFGLAKVTQLSKLRKSGIGTPAWSAPEVINPRREKYKLQADIWSVGCCILEMLTRKYPYHGFTDFAAKFKIGKGFLPSIPHTLSTDSHDFIKNCLQVDPKNRPTVAQLLEYPFVKMS